MHKQQQETIIIGKDNLFCVNLWLLVGGISEIIKRMEKSAEN